MTLSRSSVSNNARALSASFAPPWTHGLWGRGALLQNSTQLRAAQRSVLKFKLFVSLNF